MNTIQNGLARSLLVAASAAFILPAAQGQDKSAAGSQTSTAAPGQASGQAAGAAVQGGSAGAAPAANANSQQGKSQGKQAGAKAVTTLLLIPINAPEQNQWMKKGCWAKFYDDQNYAGDSLTLMGPVDMPDMTGPFGIDWKGKISSVETGPKARVLVYDNEGYRDLVSTFKPGQKTSDVSKKMGFFDEFSSLKIACDNVKAASANTDGAKADSAKADGSKADGSKAASGGKS